MKHTYTSALSYGWPECEWSLYDSSDFSTLNWLSTDVNIPTLKEVEVKMKELNDNEAKRLLRIKRNQLLAESDIKALPDFPHTSSDIKNAWLSYRQQLRNFVNNENPKLNELFELDEKTVNWPIKPN